MAASYSVRIVGELAEVELNAICDLIRQHAYWGGRPTDVTRRAFASPASLVFVARDGSGATVGCARVVTDHCTIGWVCDVIVHPDHRGRGVGKLLMRAVVEHPTLAPMRLILGTRDAHGLYEKFGFERREMMRRPMPQQPT